MRWPQASFAVLLEETSSEPQVKHSTSRGGGGIDCDGFRCMKEPKMDDCRANELREDMLEIFAVPLPSLIGGSLVVEAFRAGDLEGVLAIDTVLTGAAVPTCDMLSSGVTSSSVILVKGCFGSTWPRLDRLDPI